MLIVLQKLRRSERSHFGRDHQEPPPANVLIQHTLSLLEGVGENEDEEERKGKGWGRPLSIASAL